MNFVVKYRKPLLLLLLADFAVLSGWAMLEVGYFGIWQAGMASPGALQVLADLMVMSLLACAWMVDDARKRGIAAWPFVLVTLAAGSFGPLLYLLRREYAAARRPGAMGQFA